jgi:hypothetical protein
MEKDIARSRAEKAAEAASLSQEADEIEACAMFFQRTGGVNTWKDKWGWFSKSKKLSDYTGIRLNANNQVSLRHFNSRTAQAFP